MSSTLFSGLILHRGGKFGRIPVPQLTLDWTVSWHGLLSYWLLRATQDTALSLSLSLFLDQHSLAHICIPSQASCFVMQPCLCISGHLVSYDGCPPTQALLINRPPSPLPAVLKWPMHIAQGRQSYSRISINCVHRFVRISIKRGLSASASAWIAHL